GGNPNWLFDILTYGLYISVGGAGLGVVKSLATAAVAILLWTRSRTNAGSTKAGLWTPILCTMLAMLAMGTRLLLQPVMVSYLLLALAATLAARCCRLNDAARREGRRWKSLWPSWPLLLLF